VKKWQKVFNGCYEPIRLDWVWKDLFDGRRGPVRLSARNDTVFASARLIEDTAVSDRFFRSA